MDFEEESQDFLNTLALYIHEKLRIQSYILDKELELEKVIKELEWMKINDPAEYMGWGRGHLLAEQRRNLEDSIRTVERMHSHIRNFDLYREHIEEYRKPKQTLLSELITLIDKYK